MQSVVGGPDLSIRTSVSGSLFQKNKLIRRISTDKAFTPIPVIGTYTFLAQIGIIACFTCSGRYLARIGHKSFSRALRITRQLG